MVAPRIHATPFLCDAQSLSVPEHLIDGLRPLVRRSQRRERRVTGGKSVQVTDPKGSFLKNLVLSLVLLGVSSLLIPIVLKQIDDRKAVDQQRLQDELSRQDKVVDAQAALLATMAADFWAYELYASDVVISRDERFGQDNWHQRAVDAYYLQSGPLLGTMRAEISTLLQLAPQANYDAFLQLYEGEISALDSCLLELMKIEAASSGTPQPSATPQPAGSPQPSRCVASEGKFAGATWATLATAVVHQGLAGSLDREFANLAQAFRLQDRLADAPQMPTPES
jgi:hypothetical protein